MYTLTHQNGKVNYGLKKFIVDSVEDIEKIPELEILASSDEAGVFFVKSKNDRQIFIMGHPEYDRLTLHKEYMRDKNQGLPIDVPVNYYPNDDCTQKPRLQWRSHGNILYSNWLNYYVYQATPFAIDEIK